MCQELAVSSGEEQENAISWFELPGSIRAVVCALLLSHLQVLLYSGHDFVNLNLHVLDILNH